MANRRGFTLIELLVVIAIIAILSTIGIASFTTASQRARDGKRKGDISQTRAALEMYRSQTGTYPPNQASFAALATLLKNAQYLSDPLPADPKPSQPYTYTSGSSTYVLCAHLEVLDSGNSSSGTSINPSGSKDYFCGIQP